MDSLTHIVLGGLIGEAFVGKSMGKRALALGAVAQSIPDIDFVASFWLDTPSNLLAHRGFTHSFLLAALLTPLLSWLAFRWQGSHRISIKKWMTFFGVQIVIHLLLDSLNAYGVGWFEPFSHARISFHVLFVVDPFYSCWLGLSFLCLLVLTQKSKYRMTWTIMGLLLSSCYIGYAIINKNSLDREAAKLFQKQNVAAVRYLSTPTPLNSWLWYLVAEDSNGYHIGYRSVFDRKDSISLHYFYRNDSLLVPIRGDKGFQKLLRFSQGYYTASLEKDALIFSDLRFGQQAGWYDPTAKFVFQYDVSHPTENSIVVQRGRFANWNGVTMKSLVDRIRGQ